MSVYKNVPKPKPPRISFVEAVKQYGDGWVSAFPTQLGMKQWQFTHDSKEAADMVYMERGLFPRVKWEDLHDSPES